MVILAYSQIAQNFLRIENHFKEPGWAQTDNEAFFLHRQFLLTQLCNFENAKTPFSDDIQVLCSVFVYRCIRIFTEGDVQMPVHTFNAPMSTDRTAGQFDIFQETAYKLRYSTRSFSPFLRVFFSIMILFSPFHAPFCSIHLISAVW